MSQASSAVASTSPSTSTSTSTSTSSPRYLTSLPIDHYDTILFDCDGVLWRGSEFIEGACETLQKLEQMGKRLLFVTNNSSKSRIQYIDKLLELGIKVTKEQIFSSSYASALYISRLPTSQFNPATDLIYIIGDVGIAQEMSEAHLPYIEAKKLFGTKHWTRQELMKMEPDPRVKAVVVGVDMELTYTKVAYAQQCLAAPSTLFISTNQDSTFPAPDRNLPGGGSCVAMVACASERVPINVGKPEPLLLDAAIAHFSLDKSRTLMVGDRLDTDIEFGQRAGVHTALVLTGITRASELPNLDENSLPTYVLPSVVQLLDSSQS